MSSTSYPTGKFLIRDSTLENDMWSAQKKLTDSLKVNPLFLYKVGSFQGKQLFCP